MSSTEAETINFNEPYWNLAQVFAWVLMRDRELVHLASDNSARDTGPAWRTEEQLKDMPQAEVTGHSWEDMGDGTMKGTRLSYSAGSIVIRAWHKEKATGKTYEQAIDQPINNILQELQKENGKLKAFGLRNGKGTLKEIKRGDWIELKLFYDPDRAAIKEFYRAGASYWSSLKFESRIVLKLWPADKRKRTAKDQTQCGQWLVGLMENGSPQKKPKPDYFQEAKEKKRFSISRRTFDEEWATAVKKTENWGWSDQGRRKWER